ncbi:gamma subclass chorismate mutase AroQ [Nonomuraea longicatena]|uniref:chorismate mutase n=1 Tax=Nonomuraea longicatena TaxID=83682 RepID=A0ABP3ZBH8_9ACTN
MPAMTVLAPVLVTVTALTNHFPSAASTHPRPTDHRHLTSAQVPTNRHHALIRFVQLSADRLMLAHPVAAAKWITGRPIDDPDRERHLLTSVTERSQRMGLDPTLTTTIFRDQIEAGKLVQRFLHARWSLRPAERPTHAPDLRADIRPRLDRLTPELLESISRSRTLPNCEHHLSRALHHNPPPPHESSSAPSARTTVDGPPEPGPSSVAGPPAPGPSGVQAITDGTSPTRAAPKVIHRLAAFNSAIHRVALFRAVRSVCG